MQTNHEGQLSIGTDQEEQGGGREIPLYYDEGQTPQIFFLMVFTEETKMPLNF